MPFIEYNINDVELVDKLEDKMRLIELCLTMAYDAKVNYVDVLGSVRYWDILIYNHLREKNIVIPPKRKSESLDDRLDPLKLALVVSLVLLPSAYRTRVALFSR